MSRKRVTSLRISEYTEAQIDQLSAMKQASFSEIILIAVDRMYRDDIGGNPLKKEQKPMAIDLSSSALAIYHEIHGDVDNKFFKAEKLDEIETWLKEGDPDLDDLDALVTEWLTYIANSHDPEQERTDALAELSRRAREMSE